MKPVRGESCQRNLGRFVVSKRKSYVWAAQPFPVSTKDALAEQQSRPNTPIPSLTRTTWNRSLALIPSKVRSADLRASPTYLGNGLRQPKPDDRAL